MRAKKTLRKRLILLAICFGSGLALGIFWLWSYPKASLIFNQTDSTRLKHFIDTLTLNYWPLLIIWLSANNVFSKLLSCLTLLFRGLIIGMLLIILSKMAGVSGIFLNLKLLLCQLLLLVPYLFYYCYNALFNPKHFAERFFWSGLIAMTIYSLIISLGRITIG